MMLLTTIDRYLLRRLTGALMKALIALIALYVFVDLFTHRGAQIDRYDVPWAVVAQYYLALTPHVVTNYIAPFVMLVSALLVLGDATQNNEVVALLASGVSLRRFVRIPVLVALVFAFVVFAVQETIGPQAGRTTRRIESNYFSNNPDSERAPVSWVGLEDGWTCHILKFNRLALTGEGVLLYALRAHAHYQTVAQRIFWDEGRGQWMLERGRRQEYDPINERRLANERITQEPAPFTETPGELFALEAPPDTKSSRELGQDIQRAKARNMVVEPLLVTYYTKFSQPALTFVMIWLAIPFAMRLRRGGLAISFGASLAIAFAYIILFFVSVGMGQMGHIAPIVAAWLANMVFWAVGITMFLRTPT